MQRTSGPHIQYVTALFTDRKRIIQTCQPEFIWKQQQRSLGVHVNAKIYTLFITDDRRAKSLLYLPINFRLLRGLISDSFFVKISLLLLPVLLTEFLLRFTDIIISSCERKFFYLAEKSNKVVLSSRNRACWGYPNIFYFKIAVRVSKIPSKVYGLIVFRVREKKMVVHTSTIFMVTEILMTGSLQ